MKGKNIFWGNEMIFRRIKYTARKDFGRNRFSSWILFRKKGALIIDDKILRGNVSAPKH